MGAKRTACPHRSVLQCSTHSLLPCSSINFSIEETSSMVSSLFSQRSTSNRSFIAQSSLLLRHYFGHCFASPTPKAWPTWHWRPTHVGCVTSLPAFFFRRFPCSVAGFGSSLSTSIRYATASRGPRSEKSWLLRSPFQRLKKRSFAE